MSEIKILEMIDQPFLGGGQINLLSLAKGLDRKRFEAAICSRAGGPLVEEARKSDIRHFPVSFSKRLKGQIVKEIASILENNRFDILHTHGGVAGFYGRWAAQRCKNPVVTVHTLHGIHYLHYRNHLLRQFYIHLDRFFTKFTDAVIFVSDADRAAGCKYRLAVEGKMHVIKNGIDFSQFESKESLSGLRERKRKELSLEESSPIVGTVARLHRQKGIIYLLKAARKICHVYPRIKILIIGGGALEQKLKRETRRMGLEHCVLFLGEREDASELFSLLDVFVLPSLWEGLPYVLMEAAAWEKPVVATDIGGVREMIVDGMTGVLVPPKNSERLALAMISLLQRQDYALKLGMSLKRNLRARYTLAEMLEKTQALYIKLFSEEAEQR